MSNKGEQKNRFNIFNELLSYEYEKEWLEFKENWYDREEIGEYISALANAAALCCVHTLI